MASPAARSGLHSEFVRFLLSGLANTAATLLLFEVLRRVLPYLAAYTLTYVVGIGLSYLLNASFVFKVRKSAKSALAYPLVYVAQYLAGMLLMWALVDRVTLHPTLALIVVVLATLPLTFVLTRVMLRRLAR